ncbi:MAG TPA: hypothetical protein VFO64_01635 [Gaiellaceae bacterium]|nr:hypothetical protein [Gaiellaceae bacterium]
MTTAEQTYSYLAPSSVELEKGRSKITLATSGGCDPHPYFFTGFLGEPRQTAQALLVVGEVARTRYYEPPNMVAARIATASGTGLQDDGARDAIVRIGDKASKTSKVGKAARALLALERDDSALDEILRLAAAAADGPAA